MTTIEPLEPRQLLAADLTATLKTYTLPANQKAGTVVKGSATVLISNRDTKPLPASTKKVTVTIALRKAGSPDLIVGTAKKISLTGKVLTFSSTSNTNALASANNFSGTTLFITLG